MAKKIKLKNKKIKFILISIAIIVAIFVIFLIFTLSPSYSQEEVDIFAKCITEKGAVMYGAFWCPHCARTKKRFGSSFKFINYIECDPRGENEQAELCIKKNIKEYDTWEFNNDESNRIVGEPSFEELARKTGCIKPKEK